MKLKLSPPWITYVNEVKALFEKDPDIKVLFDNETMELKLYVENGEKAEALGAILPTEKEYGNVKLSIEVVPANKVSEPTYVDYIKRAFDGNPSLSFIYDAETPFGELHYVVFRPEVVQFYNDDMSDINGNRTMVMENVAKDVLGGVTGVCICSDSIAEDELP